MSARRMKQNSSRTGTQQSQNSLVVSIKLTVTDCRESTWREIPPAERDQRKWEWIIEDVQTCANHPDDSKSSLFLMNLRNKISKKLEHNPFSAKAFEICNSDCVRINSLDGNILGNTSLVLLDKNQTTFPFVYRQKYTTVPHTRAVTSQEGKFYGSAGNNNFLCKIDHGITQLEIKRYI